MRTENLKTEKMGLTTQVWEFMTLFINGEDFTTIKYMFLIKYHVSNKIPIL